MQPRKTEQTHCIVLTEKTASGLAGLLAIVCGVAAIVAARSFPPSFTDTDVGPSIFPTTYGAVLAALGALLFVRQLRAAPGAQDEDAGTPDLLKLALGIAGAALYVFAIGYVGFAIATVVYLWSMIVLMRGAAGLRQVTPVVLALLIGLAVHGVFVQGLQVPLPAGEWLESDA